MTDIFAHETITTNKIVTIMITPKASSYLFLHLLISPQVTKNLFCHCIGLHILEFYINGMIWYNEWSVPLAFKRFQGYCLKMTKTQISKVNLNSYLIFSIFFFFLIWPFLAHPDYSVIHAYCYIYQQFIPFYCWVVIFHCTGIPLYEYPFTGWWVFELFPIFGYYK